VKTFAPLLFVLAIASAYGFWYQNSRGRINSRRAAKSKSGESLSVDLLGSELGSRATLVQFSSAFCSPCRATRALLTDVVADLSDVAHIEIDAESHLELVRKLDIRSTPTTLILDGRGVEVGRAVGAPKRDDVIKALSVIG